MNRFLLLAVSLFALSILSVSCNDDETYADQKEREAKQIDKWITTHEIDVIKLSQFLKDTITNNPFTGPDFSKNEYVLFPDNGVYMQIISRGDGQITQSGQNRNMNVRWLEVRVSNGDTISFNRLDESPDLFYIERKGDNYSASFTSGRFPNIYGNSVPNAWIMPFMYIKPGFLNGSSAAKVRLIVPHNQGTQLAASNVYPTYYELTITTGQWQ